MYIANQELFEAPHLRPSHVLVLERYLDRVERHQTGVHHLHDHIGICAQIEGGRDVRLDAYDFCGEWITRNVCYEC